MVDKIIAFHKDNKIVDEFSSTCLLIRLLGGGPSEQAVDVPFNAEVFLHSAGDALMSAIDNGATLDEVMEVCDFLRELEFGLDANWTWRWV